MVRSYKPKTDRGKADGSLMKRAVDEVQKGRSIRQVARDLAIDRITLSRYVKKCQSGVIGADDPLVPKFNTRQVFTKEEETALEKYVLTCSLMFHGLGYSEVRKLSFEFATKKNKKFPESWTHNAMAGKDWMYGFMKRHPNISLRAPEATSMARAQGFNRRAVNTFFEIWTKLQAEKKFGPESIYNLDESGITTVQNIPKVLAARGMKQVGQITAAERGTLVSVCCCVSAMGKSLPPAMIFPRVHFKEHMLKGAPTGTLGLATQSGWINSDLFPKVLEHFIKNIGCSIEKPAVLFMDNHESHLGLEVIDMAREKGLSIITFPPHTSHRLQPLDVTVYGPLKAHYKKAVNEWNLSHPGTRITIYDLPECFNRAFLRSMSFENITEGFRKTEVWPLNSDVFTEDDFLAASIFNTRREQETDNSQEEDGDARERRDAYEEPIPSTSAGGTIEDATDTSFSELVDLRPLSKRKISDQPKHKPMKRTVSTLITSTPEKRKAEEKLKQKLLHLCKRKKQGKKNQEETSSDDEVEDDNVSENEGTSDDFVEEFDEELSDLANLLAKTPEIGDFVLVKLCPINTKNFFYYYIGQITEIQVDENYTVDFYRQFKKMTGKFVKPDIADISTIQRDDIIMCLPEPLATGGTKRVSSMVHFSIDLSKYNCQ